MSLNRSMHALQKAVHFVLIFFALTCADACFYKSAFWWDRGDHGTRPESSTNGWLDVKSSSSRQPRFTPKTESIALFLDEALTSHSCMCGWYMAKDRNVLHYRQGHSDILEHADLAALTAAVISVQHISQSNSFSLLLSRLWLVGLWYIFFFTQKSYNLTALHCSRLVFFQTLFLQSFIVQRIGSADKSTTLQCCSKIVRINKF